MMTTGRLTQRLNASCCLALACLCNVVSQLDSDWTRSSHGVPRHVRQLPKAKSFHASPQICDHHPARECGVGGVPSLKTLMAKQKELAR